MKTGVKPRPVADRFWEKVDKRGPDECWPWTASVKPSGYGQMGKGGKYGASVAAHRISFELAHGRPVRPGRIVMHVCDNPPCVNPSHLREGTYADNSRDMVLKGRCKQSKITRAAAARIRILRWSGLSPKRLGEMFGIHRNTVYGVLSRRSWK